MAGSVFGTFGRCMLRGPSADFLREVAFGSQMFKILEIILRDRCSASGDSASVFAAGAVLSALDSK